MTKLTHSNGVYYNSKGESTLPPDNLPCMLVNDCCFICDNETELENLSATLQALLSQAAQSVAANLEYYE